MAIIDVVKLEVDSTELCHKFPSQDLRLGTQLVVYPAQTAFFVKGGVICDQFDEPGTHTIETENIPILGKLINLAYGHTSPFQAEVWFINKITKLDMKWGTPTPIQLEDPAYNIIVPVGAFGQYGIKVSDPRLLLETLVGNMSVLSTTTIDQYFKGKLVSNFSSILAKKILKERMSVLDINMYLMDISEFCKDEIGKHFEKYGIELVDFSIMSINIPQNDPSLVKIKETKALMAGMNISGKDVYQMERSFDVLDKAAASGSQIMGLGFGLGVSDIIGGMGKRRIDIDPQPAPPPIPQETSYFVYANGKQIAGQTAAEIADMISKGIIDSETLVWTAGMKDWAPIKTISALASSCIPPTPPSIPQK